MSASSKPNPEVQPKAERRRFSAEYKRRIVAEAEQCQHGELRALLRREGLTYAQIGKWRQTVAEGTVGKKRGPVANPNRAEMRRLEAENARLKRQLERAEAIIDAQKKLARLLEEEQS
ncbi:MAG: transposase [Chloroflexi bacterium]|nr:transposase [Chloroflexota bacterium]